MEALRPAKCSFCNSLLLLQSRRAEKIARFRMLSVKLHFTGITVLFYDIVISEIVDHLRRLCKFPSVEEGVSSRQEPPLTAMPVRGCRFHVLKRECPQVLSCVGKKGCGIVILFSEKKTKKIHSKKTNHIH